MFDEFWPYYVSQHLNPVNRRLHFCGTTLGFGFGAVAALTAAYGFAWAGHYFYERNRPATLAHPLLSLRADFRMSWLMLRGEMDAEIRTLTKELQRLRAD